MVIGPSAPLQLHRQKPSVGVDVTRFQSLVPTLKVWAQQLNLLKVNPDKTTETFVSHSCQQPGHSVTVFIYSGPVVSYID